jgi:hypothetical protein
MNGEPPPVSVWSRSWSGPLNALTWVALLFVSIFVILLSVSLTLGPSAISGPDVRWMALASALVALLLAAASVFFRWLCHWRNFRRLLLGLVALLCLLAAAWTWVNWSAKRAWQWHSRLLEARGVPLTISALAPPPVPDQKNFALTPPFGLDGIRADLSPARNTNDRLVLGQLETGTFAKLTACALFYRGNTNYPQAPAAAAPGQVILTALGRFAPELKELSDAAATRPESRFPVRYDQEPASTILLPHLARVKALALLSQVRATAFLDAGQPADALDDLRLGFRLADSIRNEPLLIDHLVRIAALAFDLQTVREGLLRHSWDERQLAELEAGLARLNLLAEYKHAMLGERACETEIVDYIIRQKTNAPCDPAAIHERLMPTGFLHRNMLTISRFFEDFTFPTVDERSHRVYPDLSAKGERVLLAMRGGPSTYLARMLLPALQKAAQKSARAQTYVDATHLACVLERYRLANGRLPASLNDLVPRFLAAIPADVIDGKPLRYRLHPDGGFVLYSIGWNQIDDGGQLASAKQKNANSVDPAQGDWVWLMAAK